MTPAPPHPGALLRRNVLNRLRLEVTEAAERLGVSRVALSRVLNGHAGVSPALAIRLEKAGLGPARYWFGNRILYDLAQARRRDRSAVRPLGRGAV